MNTPLPLGRATRGGAFYDAGFGFLPLVMASLWYLFLSISRVQKIYWGNGLGSARPQRLNPSTPTPPPRHIPVEKENEKERVPEKQGLTHAKRCRTALVWRAAEGPAFIETSWMVGQLEGFPMRFRI